MTFKNGFAGEGLSKHVFTEEHRLKLSISAKEAWTRVRVKTNPDLIFCQKCGKETPEWTEVSHPNDYKLKLKYCLLCQKIS